MLRARTNTLDTQLQDRERCLWTVYNLTVLLLSLVGNTTILVATIKHTVKLHRVLVVILQHLTVNNLLFSVFNILLPALQLLTNPWPHVDLLCFTQDHLSWLYCPLAGSLTCALLVTKLLIVRCPLRARSWSRGASQAVCVLLWVVFVYLCVQAGPIFRYSTCAPAVLELPKVDWIEKSDFIQSVCFVVIATIMILAAVLIPFKALKRTENSLQHLQCQSLVGVTLLTILYLFSFLPSISISVAKQADISPAALRTVHYLRNINTIAIVVYCLLVGSFRDFLRVKLRTVSRCLVRTQGSRPRTQVSQSDSLECILQDC